MMKKHWLLISSWAVAAVLIAVLASRASAARRALGVNPVGTFGTALLTAENGAVRGDPCYLAFDRDGGYICYDSSGQRHHEGAYTVDGRVVSLSGDGGDFSAVYVDDTVYLYGPDGGVDAYFRVSQVPSYIEPSGPLAPQDGTGF